MSSQIEFETPENVQVAYQVAGLGTRFVAWFVDNILMFLAGIVIFLLLICSGVITESVVRDISDSARGSDRNSPFDPNQVGLYFVGLIFLVTGLGSFVYYGCSELFLRGQTIGKRMSGIRVVRLDGFSLEPGSIFVRNIFRVVDHIPPLWIVPLVSGKSQRLGDMVAGTVVVADKPKPINDLRQSLAQSAAAGAKFVFDNAALKRARPQDFQAVERILERWTTLTDSQQRTLLDQVAPPLAARLKTDVPADDERLQYLTDLLAAEYRRQHRSLG
jgi:uncharacterized RDD family membrane protein YckC